MTMNTMKGAVLALVLAGPLVARANSLTGYLDMGGGKIMTPSGKILTCERSGTLGKGVTAATDRVAGANLEIAKDVSSALNKASSDTRALLLRVIKHPTKPAVHKVEYYTIGAFGSIPLTRLTGRVGKQQVTVEIRNGAVSHVFRRWALQQNPWVKNNAKDR